MLHHLPDPAEGLRALPSVLAPGGGLGLMVYAPHGRTGVYMVQDALRLLAPADEPPAARLDVARRVMRHLPETAWLRQNRFLDDHVNGGDAGLYDLLLNPRDRAFTVPQLVALLAGAGLRVACWVEPLRYDPLFWLPDPKLRARAASAGPDRARRAGRGAGRQHQRPHRLLRARRRADRSGCAETGGPIPTGRPPVPRRRADRPRSRRRAACRLHPAGRHDHHGVRRPARADPAAGDGDGDPGLVDGQRTVGEIGAALAARGSTPEAFSRAWRATFTTLEQVNRLLLAAPA